MRNLNVPARWWRILSFSSALTISWTTLRSYSPPVCNWDPEPSAIDMWNGRVFSRKSTATTSFLSFSFSSSSALTSAESGKAIWSRRHVVAFRASAANSAASLISDSTLPFLSWRIAMLMKERRSRSFVYTESRRGTKNWSVQSGVGSSVCSLRNFQSLSVPKPPPAAHSWPISVCEKTKLATAS